MTTSAGRDRLNWNLMKAFLEITRFHSFAAAARAAGVQRPTVSQKIAELEAALGFALMERQPGSEGFQLTDRGRQLRRLVADFDKRFAALRNAAAVSAPTDEVTDVLIDVEEALAALHRAAKALRKS